MRNHVSRHILDHDIDPHPNLCGFCGISGLCSIELRKARAKFYKPMSNCNNFKEFKLDAAVKLTKSNPSSNRPVSCSLCVDKTVNF